MKWQAAKRANAPIDRRGEAVWTPEQSWQLDERLAQARPDAVPALRAGHYKALADLIATSLAGQKPDISLSDYWARHNPYGVSPMLRNYHDLTAPDPFSGYAPSLEQALGLRKR